MELRYKNKLIILITTLFGIGYIPICGGTIASLLGMLSFILIDNYLSFVFFSIFFLYLSFILSGKAEAIFGEKDCKKIVIDDFVGSLVAFLFIPRDIRFIVAGILLFRILDILKIFPIDRVEELEGAKGIVGDDLIAGIYTNILLQIIRLFRI
ncbi:MAG: phosphatidylglycerophosphatase A [Candidatus Omnitrophica bacterium]|nr:phosphatidylglycerophosphatase A [Candidatus Omnitrophota bacterium]MCM8826122.1 phosphatidylglycerophosphatase A [Candidatus Omnitrophota bacterium]